MAKSFYDQINKLKDKYNSIIEEKDNEISSLKERVVYLENKNDEYRKKLYDAGEGKGERNKLKKVIAAQERDNKTLKNQIKKISGETLISTFSSERQELIRRIKKLDNSYNIKLFNYLAKRFINGLDNVIEVAALIKNKTVEDMDYFTFVFRDNIVGLLEKILKVVLHEKEESASKYLVKLADSRYKFPNDYYVRMPELKDKNLLTNILYLINLQTTGYHGTRKDLKHNYVDKETQEIKKSDRFLNLSNDDQLDAIFTLLKFMYDVFTNKDYETNLMDISTNWYKTIK